MKIISTLLLILTFVNLSIASGNEENQSFGKAKKTLLKQVYRDQHLTFYCNSEFNSKKQVFHTSGYVPVKHNKRANWLEWEHIVPAHIIFGT